MLFDQKKELSTKRVSHNERYATKKPSTPPGTLRQTWCEICAGWFYGTRCPFEADHRRLRHGQSK